VVSEVLEATQRQSLANWAVMPSLQPTNYKCGIFSHKKGFI